MKKPILAAITLAIFSSPVFADTPKAGDVFTLPGGTIAKCKRVTGRGRIKAIDLANGNKIVLPAGSDCTIMETGGLMTPDGVLELNFETGSALGVEPAPDQQMAQIANPGHIIQLPSGTIVDVDSIKGGKIRGDIVNGSGRVKIPLNSNYRIIPTP